MIPRFLEKAILDKLQTTNKLILILGARQVGKTTLLKNIQKKIEKKKRSILYLNCDIEEDRSAIDTTSLSLIKALTRGVNYVFIDEAQRLENPGLTLKIIHDNIPNLKVIATGSSSFDLRNKLSDALTGRYVDFTLYPLSLSEVLHYLKDGSNKILRQKRAEAILNSVLLYGLYPEIFLAAKEESKKLYLSKIIESYLYLDILMFQRVRNPQVIKNLAQALAYQIGSEINENELSMRLKVDRKTIVNYLDILEQAFVIVRLFPYSKNPRREIGKRYKVYFTDIGVRNSLIGDFNNIAVRGDIGALWENFLIIERLKYLSNKGQLANFNFWRSYGGAEIDLLERVSTGTKIKAFEIKYKQSKISKGASLFSKKNNIPVRVINKNNYLEFIE